jgi:succinate dehydrogenase hydrophobic anchor subunit
MERRVKAAPRSGWRPILAAFTIWFVHFMACWAAVEIWPHRWLANATAWGATALALLALGVHFVRVRAAHADGALGGWHHRFAQGATALATAAVLFGALPSIVLRP